MRTLSFSILRRLALMGVAFGFLALSTASAVSAAPEGEEEPGQTNPTGSEAGHESPSIDPKKLGLQLLNFGVLVFVLVKFGGGAVNKALKGRHEQLKADLASAAEARKAAEAKLAKQEARLGSLEQEIADMRRDLKKEAEAEKARLIATAEERATRIKAETAFLIEQQVRDADQRLRRESADAALKIAEEILRRSIGAGDQQRLLETFVSDLGREPGAGRVV
ncbi:MAG TPA: ATP synthase F0 subunit B [Polyangia bacterium]|jgi:F-type H+-transporting ATPase subunit b